MDVSDESESEKRRGLEGSEIKVGVGGVGGNGGISREQTERERPLLW